MCLTIPGKIVGVEGAAPMERTARVSFGGIVKEVSLACLPEAVTGDYVLVHAGLALSTLDEAEARRVFDLLEQMEEEAGGAEDG